MTTKRHPADLKIPRQDDALWVRTHGAEVAAYVGRWIAVLDGKVLADGVSASDVADRLAERRVSGALITLVRRERPANSVSIA